MGLSNTNHHGSLMRRRVSPRPARPDPLRPIAKEMPIQTPTLVRPLMHLPPTHAIPSHPSPPSLHLPVAQTTQIQMHVPACHRLTRLTRASGGSTPLVLVVPPTTNTHSVPLPSPIPRPHRSFSPRLPRTKHRQQSTRKLGNSSSTCALKYPVPPSQED